MEKDTILGRDVEILTIPEFIEKKKRYFLGQSMNVVKCFSTTGYQIWTKHKTLEDVAKIFWKHEPLVKRYMSSEQECIDQLRDSYKDKGMSGVVLRWLPGNRSVGDSVVLQPYAVPGKDIEADIDKYINLALQDTLFGILMDPFVYCGILVDENGEYLDDSPEFLNQDNYRVFCIDLDKDEYEKQELEYVESRDTGKFNDGLMSAKSWNSFEPTEELKNFYKKYTKWPL